MRLFFDSLLYIIFIISIVIMTNTVKNKFCPEIDMMKGISILMIIAIHSTTPDGLKQHLPFIHLVSCSFALCLFFVIGGFLYHHDSTPIKEFLKKKVVRLMLPYFFFAILDTLLRFIFSNYTNNPDNDNLLLGLVKVLTGRRYWFLWSMFFILIINRIFFRYRVLLMIICFIVSIMNFCKTDFFTLENSIYYNVFFCVGYYINPFYNHIKDYIDRNVVLCLASSFILYFILLLFPHSGFQNHWLLQFSGCAFIWILCLALKPNNFLLHLGKYSMQYYSIHVLITFAFFPLGRIAFRYSNSYFVEFFVIYCFVLAFTYLGLLCEKRIKPLYPFWGL